MAKTGCPFKTYVSHFDVRHPRARLPDRHARPGYDRDEEGADRHHHRVDAPGREDHEVTGRSSPGRPATGVGGACSSHGGVRADNRSADGSPGGTVASAPPPPAPPASTVGALDHVFMAYMENKGYADVVGSPNAPYINSLIATYGVATAYYALTHPSDPNYYPILGGSDFGFNYNCPTNCFDEHNLADTIEANHQTWAGYAQGMSPAGPYVETAEYAQANNMEGPVNSVGGVLSYVASLLTNRQYNIKAGDRFIHDAVSTIMNSAVWQDTSQKSAIFLTFDEDSNNLSLGFANEGNHVVTIVIPSPGAAAAGMRTGNFTADGYATHYSLLRTIEDALGLPALTANDAYAQPMNGFWKPPVIV